MTAHLLPLFVNPSQRLAQLANEIGAGGTIGKVVKTIDPLFDCPHCHWIGFSIKQHPSMEGLLDVDQAYFVRFRGLDLD